MTFRFKVAIATLIIVWLAIDALITLFLAGMGAFSGIMWSWADFAIVFNVGVTPLLLILIGILVFTRKRGRDG